MINAPLAMKLCGFLYICILITNAASVGLGNSTGETDSTAMLPTISENPHRYRMGVIVAIASGDRRDQRDIVHSVQPIQQAAGSDRLWF